MLSTIVTYKHPNGKKTECDMYEVIPNITVKFASGSRVNSGLKLLYRSARHESYEHEPGIRDTSISICKFKGEICIGVTERVSASFYDKADKRCYMITVYINVQDLLC